ncbi:MAG TPA: molybdopterin biosynthesis protein, partial [Elusimicrobia bacterium]|nr:molybdopterin biosynthesis protein [Elusimicrobiota bacterium]
MITFEQAIAAVLRAAKSLPPVPTPVEQAVGRALAEDVRSAVEMPPFDKSAVDGYAVRAAEVSPGARLRCRGLVQAGQSYKGRLKPGDCVKVMTGAPVPAGADAVVMVEETAENGGLVEFSRTMR